MRISKQQKAKYDCAIKYIKSEHNSGRHIIACLGSAGYTFITNIENLAKYAESQGEFKFAKLIRE